ncbi:TetR/AcrR family transcriptional regulator [Colwellia sp. MEBiC06753]
MRNQSVIQAKQVRSQRTQQKLLAALNSCLKEQFFEHISIAQLTDAAGVSVGTFYRRFKNKEALLPDLYQDFGTNFIRWLATLEKQPQANLTEQIAFIVQQTANFLNDHLHVLRTLHLNARLYPEILPASQLSQRSSEYQRLAALLLAHKTEISHPNPVIACDMVIFIISSNLIDKLLYATLTPAIASPLSLAENCQELTLMIKGYLQP